jgi:Fic family protein
VTIHPYEYGNGRIARALSEMILARSDKILNAGQRSMLNRLLEGFEGKLTTSKWAMITECSHDTALRDIQDLMTKGIIKKAEEAGGRSTYYELFEK